MAVSISAIIVAAGRSTRFGQPGKPFAPLLGRTVLEWSLRSHRSCHAIREIVVVGRVEDEERVRELAARSVGDLPFSYVPGGTHRQESVANGLKAVSLKSDLISIHDAARPGVTGELIEAVAGTAEDIGAAIPGIPAKDTIKLRSREGTVLQTPDRTRLWQVGTPQIFRTHVLFDAYEKARGKDLEATDDAALVEAMGYPVAIVEGDENMMKITTPSDLRALEGMLGGGATRVGFGYDIHATDPTRELRLGGVLFEEGPGLAGHSDADVICHAAADALLGAAALGDIGQHFPNTDPSLRGASSIRLLELVRGILASAGFVAMNLDVTLIAERPKVMGRAEEMRDNLAGALGLAREQVSVKATTAEGIGAAGRGECMEAHAVAQVAFAAGRPDV